MLQRGGCALGATLVVLLMLLPYRRSAPASMPVRAVEVLDDVQDLAKGVYGTVDEGIYSYGAPGTSLRSLVDLSHKDGCFAGLRVWNEDARRLALFTTRGYSSTLSILFYCKLLLHLDVVTVIYIHIYTMY